MEIKRSALTAITLKLSLRNLRIPHLTIFEFGANGKRVPHSFYVEKFLISGS